MKERLLNWFTFWAVLVDGVAGILTFGFWYPRLSYRAMAWYLDNTEGE